MEQAGDGLGFGDKALAVLWGCQRSLKEHFHGDSTVQVNLTRPPNDTHTAATQLGLESIAIEDKACLEQSR
jgi:hypothetical protein